MEARDCSLRHRPTCACRPTAFGAGLCVLLASHRSGYGRESCQSRRRLKLRPLAGAQNAVKMRSEGGKNGEERCSPSCVRRSEEKQWFPMTPERLRFSQVAQ